MRFRHRTPLRLSDRAGDGHASGRCGYKTTKQQNKKTKDKTTTKTQQKKQDTKQKKYGPTRLGSEQFIRGSQQAPGQAKQTSSRSSVRDMVGSQALRHSQSGRSAKRSRHPRRVTGPGPGTRSWRGALKERVRILLQGNPTFAPMPLCSPTLSSRTDGDFVGSTGGS